jgi:transcriptional regulator with XRE-family HTH domain
MLTVMDAAQLVSQVKSASGLSVRELTTRANVAASTYTRIHAGDIDPTVGTLGRLLRAAGCELRLEAVPFDEDILRVGDLSTAWSERGGRVRVDWTRWRAFLDELTRRPELVPEAIYSPPLLSGQPVIDSLLAGVAEKLADDAHLRRPTWTRKVPPLAEPFCPPTARHVPNRAIPAQFTQRRLMIDAESLWRVGGRHDA